MDGLGLIGRLDPISPAPQTREVLGLWVQPAAQLLPMDRTVLFFWGSEVASEQMVGMIRLKLNYGDTINIILTT